MSPGTFFGFLTLSKIPYVSFLHLLEYCRIFWISVQAIESNDPFVKNSPKVSLGTLRLFEMLLHYIHFFGNNQKFEFSHYSVSDLRYACIAIFAADKLSEPHFIITN